MNELDHTNAVLILWHVYALQSQSIPSHSMWKMIQTDNKNVVTSNSAKCDEVLKVIWDRSAFKRALITLERQKTIIYQNSYLRTLKNLWNRNESHLFYVQQLEKFSLRKLIEKALNCLSRKFKCWITFGYWAFYLYSLIRLILDAKILKNQKNSYFHDSVINPWNVPLEHSTLEHMTILSYPIYENLS